MRFSYLLLLATLVALPAAAQPGALDPSFAGEGIAVGPLPASVVTDVRTDAADNAVVAGNYRDGAFVARYTPSGVLDWYTTITSGTALYRADAVTILGDGSYLLAGHTEEGALLLVRTRPFYDGMTFCTGSETKREVPMGMDTVPGGAAAMIALRSGEKKGLTVMRVTAGLTSDACAIDTGWGDDGTVTALIPNAHASAEDVAVQPDGRIVVAGTSRYVDHSDADMVAARLTPAGAYDASFGYNGAGYLVYDPGDGEDDFTTAVALGPDGEIVLSGWAKKQDKTGFAALRLRADGIPDSAFGYGGFTFVQPAPDVDAIANDVVVDKKGRVVLVGNVGDAWGLVRLRAADGRLDLDFGTGGVTITRPFGYPGGLNAVSLSLHELIVPAGFVKKAEGEAFAVARYFSDVETTASEGAPSAATALRVSPNPAQDATTLTVSLRTAGTVHADLYDLLGRRVATLADAVRSTGTAQVDLDLVGVPAGIYILRAVTPDGVQAQRLTVR